MRHFRDLHALITGEILVTSNELLHIMYLYGVPPTKLEIDKLAWSDNPREQIKETMRILALRGPSISVLYYVWLSALPGNNN